jgi:hypothetical protein
VGGVTFFIRRDPESEREVAFAINEDYLLLATREDLMASALQRMAGRKDNTIEAEAWWSQSVAAAGAPGDLRMVLNMEKIVSSPYFRSYWIQQNITDMKQYSSAICDLVRSGTEYREERVLLKRGAAAGEPDQKDKGSTSLADLLRLVPAKTAVYEARANPSATDVFAVLEGKMLLAPHLGPAVAAKVAPQVDLGNGQAGASSDLETRIDQSPAIPSASASGNVPTELSTLFPKNRVMAMLQVQSTEQDKDGIFVRIPSGIALVAESDWDEAAARNALSDFLRPSISTGQLGVEWRTASGYAELNGLWTLAVAVRGKYLLISDQGALMAEMLTNMKQPSSDEPAIFAAGFNHGLERERFAQLAGMLDHSSGAAQSGSAINFFSGNITSLSATLANLSSEKIVVRDAGNKVLQTATYKWGN